MYEIPEQIDVLKTVGGYIGAGTVNTAAVVGAIAVLRSGIKDPKIIAGAFSLYASAKHSGTMMGESAGESFDLFLKKSFGVDVDKFINENIKQINEVINKYFGDIQKQTNSENQPKKQLSEQEIKDEVDKRVQEYIRENDMTSIQDIVQFTNKTREELKNGTINTENQQQNKEQNLKEEVQAETNNYNIQRR